MQQCSTFCHDCFVFHSNSWSHLILEDPIITYTVYCCAPLLMVFQDLSLCVPEKCQHHFPCCWLCFELLLLVMSDVYSPYPGAFSVAHVVDSCLLPSDSACQECLNYVTVAVKQASADCQWLLLSSFVSCLGTHDIETLLKPSPFGMISWTVLCLMYRRWVTLTVVTCQMFRQ